MPRKKVKAMLPLVAVSFATFADITVTESSIVCGKESAILAVKAMTKLNNLLELPDSCRQLKVELKGNIANVNHRLYVKVKTELGDEFFTLTKSIKH